MGEKSDRGEVKNDPWDGATVASTCSDFEIINGQSLESLWTLYRVWNTTALLCAYHQETEAGLEEEE